MIEKISFGKCQAIVIRFRDCKCFQKTLSLLSVSEKLCYSNLDDKKALDNKTFCKTNESCIFDKVA